ncbi:MAG: DsrE family protein [Bacteroidetes bacterium]|nr:DsrE family protein [Bacteroidota bacterium]
MKKLNVLWTTGEKDVALRMIFVYLLNAKSIGWWDDITLIIWGPSAKLVAENRLIQKELDYLLQSGINVQACEGCTEAYGVTDEIRALGIPVRYMGETLTEILTGDEKLITF